MTTGLIRFDRLFDRAFSDFLAPVADGAATRGWLPAVDIKETPAALSLAVELPGLSKDDVNVTVEDNILTISGERKFEKSVKEENFHRVERSYGAFSRSFALPRNVTFDQIDAKHVNGVLTLTLPKAEQAKPRKIEIQ